MSRAIPSATEVTFAAMRDLARAHRDMDRALGASVEQDAWSEAMARHHKACDRLTEIAIALFPDEPTPARRGKARGKS